MALALFPLFKRKFEDYDDDAEDDDAEECQSPQCRTTSMDCPPLQHRASKTRHLPLHHAPVTHWESESPQATAAINNVIAPAVAPAPLPALFTDAWLDEHAGHAYLDELAKELIDALQVDIDAWSARYVTSLSFMNNIITAALRQEQVEHQAHVSQHTLVLLARMEGEVARRRLAVWSAESLRDRLRRGSQHAYEVFMSTQTPFEDRICLTATRVLESFLAECFIDETELTPMEAWACQILMGDLLRQVTAE